MSVKTRQAIRSVLNDLRQCIHTLQQEGVLEETEGKELESVSWIHSYYRVVFLCMADLIYMCT